MNHSNSQEKYQVKEKNSDNKKKSIDPLFFLNQEEYKLYNIHVARFLGSINAAVFLSELVQRRKYHRERNELIDDPKHGNGWIFQTIEAIEEFTALSRYEQESCIKKLKEKDLIEVVNFGIPNRRHFRLNNKNILAVYESQFVENQQTSLGETNKLVCQISANQSALNLQTALYIEEPKEEPKEEDIAQSTQTEEPFRAKTKTSDPLNFDHQQKEFIGISAKDLADWQEAYPGIAIPQEIAKMRQWVLANPSKAKKSRWRKFITNWLSGAYDKLSNKAAYQSGKGSTVDRRTKNIDGTPVDSAHDGRW